MSAGRVIFDHVWKRFTRGPAHNSLRDVVPALGRRVFRGAKEREALRQQEFWAIRDVTFEVNPGETLGIIGGNGAGKSTTLKLLTKILQPTKGIARLEGRVGALIEISAGFHQDLTGRENVFLQGAIMGMPQALIRERFDEIVAFSGVAPFIDTPTKRYSSGMNARLGFSIAVHLAPDVLIIDEVLSVGDVEFQARAFGRIRDMANSGLPVVIVSHQLDRIAELCGRCLLLRNGSVAYDGTPAVAISAYLNGLGPAAAPPTTQSPLQIESLEPKWSGPVDSGSSVELVIRAVEHEPTAPADVSLRLALRDVASGRSLYMTNIRRLDLVVDGAPNTCRYDVALDANVPPGMYRIESYVYDHRTDLITQDGPSAALQVVTKDGFVGSVQLNVRQTGGG